MPDTPTYTTGNTIPLLVEDAMKSTATWKPTKEEGEVLHRVMHRIENEMLPSQQAFWQEWDDAKRIYECYVQPDPTRTREAFKVPISHMITEAALAEEIDAFPDIMIDTQEDEDKQKLPILNSAKKYALARGNWDKIRMEALRIRRIYGWAAVRIYYSRETRIIKQRKPVKGDGGMMIAYEEVVDYPWDDIRFEVIDNPKRFLIDDSAKDLDDTSARGADDCALITDLTWGQAREMLQHDKRFKNTEFVKPGAEYWINDKMELVIPEQQAQDETKKVRMIEYWNRRTYEYITIMNGIIVRQSPLVDDHGELPFAVMHMYRRPHSFYSKGVPKLIESLEACYNAIMQAEVRATKLAFPILRIDEDGTVDPRSVSSYPGVVMEGPADSIELMQLGSVPAEVYQLKDKLESLLIWVTGINFQQVFSENSGELRVGVEALKKESMLSRVNANLRENEANFVVRIGNLLMQDIMQYYTVPKIRRLTNKDDVAKLGKEKIRWESTVMPRLVKDKDTKLPKGVWELRKIPVEGMQIRESANEEKGVFTLLNDGAGSGSYILARPEYIRTQSKLDVRAVRPSAMGSSKEAKKLLLIELSNHAMEVNMQNLVDGVPTPIWDMNWLETQVAEVNELPVKKAIISEKEKAGNTAKKKLEEIAGPVTDVFKKQMDFQKMKDNTAVTDVNAQQSQGMVDQAIQ